MGDYVILFGKNFVFDKFTLQNLANKSGGV